MSCYIRHLKQAMLAVGLPDDRTGRNEADRRIRSGLAAVDADCPEVWRRVKALTSDELQALLRDRDAGDLG